MSIFTHKIDVVAFVEAVERVNMHVARGLSQAISSHTAVAGDVPDTMMVGARVALAIDPDASTVKAVVGEFIIEPRPDGQWGVRHSSQAMGWHMVGRGLWRRRARWAAVDVALTASPRIEGGFWWGGDIGQAGTVHRRTILAVSETHAPLVDACAAADAWLADFADAMRTGGAS